MVRQSNPFILLPAFRGRSVWILMLLLLTLSSFHCGRTRKKDRPISIPEHFDINSAPDIVLISIDTFRADHMGGCGYIRNTTPVLDSVASSGILYKHAISQAPWTLPSMASIVTSLYSSEHGASLAKSSISAETLLISELLQDIGYQTIGVITHTFVDAQHGFNQGYDVFDMENVKGHDAVTSQDVVHTAERLVNESAADDPLFLWIHFFDPHFSFVRHPEYGFADGFTTTLPDTITGDDPRMNERSGNLNESDVDYVRAVYDEEIAYTDGWIGRLLSHRRLASAVVFITADHGTYFRERGRFFHGKDVYEALVHVPLVIGGSIADSLKGRIVDQPVEVSSIPHTIESMLGFQDHHFSGTDLIGLAATGQAGSERLVFTEGNYAWGSDDRKTAVIDSRWKLIRNHDPGTYEMYDLVRDAEEMSDLWDVSDSTLILIRNYLRLATDDFPPGEKSRSDTIRMDKETMERLRSLGYIK